MKIYLSNYWRKSSIFIVCLSAIITVATAVFCIQSYDEEDYILDILHLRISRILVDGDPYGYRELIKKYIEPEVGYISTHEEDSGGPDITFTCYYNLEGNLLGMYTWMHDIRIPIAAIDKFEKEMKKRSIAIFNQTPSGEKYKRVPYVKMMLSYTFGKSK